MKRPIHRASLDDLLCIVQRGSGLLDETGELIPNYVVRLGLERYLDHQAEAEITRRFKALERKIRRLEADQ